MNKPQYPDKIQGLTYDTLIQNPDGTISIDGRIDLRQDPSKKLISADEIGERFVVHNKSMEEITEALYELLLSTTSIYKDDVVERHNANEKYNEYKQEDKIKEQKEEENKITFPEIAYSYEYNTGSGRLRFKNSFHRNKNVSEEIRNEWNPYFEKFRQGVNDAFNDIKSRANIQDGLMARKAYEYGFFFGHGVAVGKSNGMNGNSSNYGKPYKDNNKDKAYSEGYDVGYKVGREVYNNEEPVYYRGGNDNAFFPSGRENKVLRAVAGVSSGGLTEVARLFDKDLFK